MTAQLDFVGGAEISTSNLVKALAERSEIERIYLVGCGLSRKNNIRLDSYSNSKIQVMRIENLFISTSQKLYPSIFKDHVFSYFIGRTAKDICNDVDIIFVQDGISAYALRKISQCNKPKFGLIRDYWPICPRSSCGSECVQDHKVCAKKISSNLSYLFNSAYLYFKRNFFKKAYAQLTHKVFVSKYVKTTISDDGVVIHNFIEQSVRKKQIQKFQSNLIYAGRLDPAKGVEYLIRAVNMVKLKKKNVKLAIYGDGPELRNLKKITKELHLERNISFNGVIRKEDLYSEISKSNLLVCPSIWPEPLGRVIYESMACGTPVVAFDVGGNREIISNKQDGILVKQIDSHNLAKGILELLELSHQEQLSRNCYNKVKK